MAGGVGPAAVGARVNTVDVSKLVASLGRAVEDLTPFFAWLDTDLSRLFRAQFETRGATFGTPWAPLSPVTLTLRINRRMRTKRARRAAAGAAGADTPLVDSGGLMAAFTKPGGPGSARAVGKLTYERGVTYAPDGVPVAALMQSGWKSTYAPVLDRHGEAVFVRRKAPKTIPPRPIVPDKLPSAVLAAWEGQLVQYLEAGLIAASPAAGLAARASFGPARDARTGRFVART